MLSFGGHDMLEKPEAEAVLPRALAVLEESPGDVKALGDVGHCYNVLEQEELALEYFAKASTSGNPYSWINYAAILRQCAQHEKAKLFAWNAHRVWPDEPKAGHIYAEELIREGKWLKAWPLCSKFRASKAVLEEATRRDIPGAVEWRGQDLAGKHIAVISEGGRGDLFWLIRFIPKLTERGATVSILAPKDLANFFEGHPYLGNPNDEAHARAYDYWVSIFELLQWLEVDKPYWPGPYLSGTRRTFIGWDHSRPKVGLCWDCGELVDVRKYRSMKDEQAEVLLSYRNVQWVSLQKDKKPPLYCVEPVLNTWRDTASIISALDLVVTMDTAVAHLSGAMGKETWLVLGGFQDCKWMTGETTGWYPSFRIFRNEGFGFENVLGKVIRALRSRFGEKVSRG